MSIEACLHFVEVSHLEYRPSVNDMRKIMAYLHITDFNAVHIYRRKLNWEDDENGDYPLKRYRNISRNNFLKIYKEYLESYTIDNPVWAYAKFNEWAHRFADHFEYIPTEINGNYCPADFSFYIGNTDIPAIDFESVQITSHFQVKMGGNQMPIDFDEYLSILSKDDKICDLLHFLSSLEIGLEYRLFMSAYY